MVKDVKSGFGGVMLQSKLWMRNSVTALLVAGSVCVGSTALAADNVRLGYMKADDVNVRESASADGEVIGKIGTNDTLLVISSKGEYYQIQFNGKVGYVIDDYARTSDYQTGSINAKDVVMRASSSTDSKKISSLSKGDVVNVYGSFGDFCRITFDDKVGYVSKQYVDIGGVKPEPNTEKAEPEKKPEPKAQPTEMELKTIGEEAAASSVSKASMKLHGNDPEPNSKPEVQPTDIPAYSLELEEIGELKKIEEAAPVSRKVDAGSYSDDELYLLAQVTYAEGKGQSSDGYKAIASVIFNRLQSNKFPDTVNGVCYQSGQFSVIHLSGFSSSVPSERAMEAVKSVFANGEVTLPSEIMYFKSSRLSRDWGAYRSYYATIGANMFYS